MTIDLREEIKKGKPIYGLANTVKKLKLGKLQRIFLSSNCPDKEGILKMGKQFGVEVVEMKETNTQLGVICKKSFAISVLSF